MIVTCRDKKQGGQGDWPLELRMEIVTAAIKAGAEYVDCEYETILIAEVEKKTDGRACRFTVPTDPFAP